ncbi:Gfo/Idh/MocA family protein [Calycomorphotria hydatis]|uniref:Inositol 2-dehydrogenase n=1 Tax=Calycomorphotria hydatis TaxID=2528027 RepID=A0A517TDV5_9PLAN|nr:Gfo/Idh/MocA family oxidoreductase [Calycomorphotria hydatis]QDT66554.1 Inositol 2-dehydrogenase [Calycomorphotria hydatis]
MRTRTNRRQFLQTSTAASTAWWVGHGLSANARGDEQTPPSAQEKLYFACIGVGGRGSSDTDAAGRHGEVLALCDVDERNLANKAKRFPNAKAYRDYRELLSDMNGTIDAITISTPDHTHAAIAAAAMREGKHVFCQTPLAWSIDETRTLMQLAGESGVCTQLGIQGTANPGWKQAVDIIQQGTIGDVEEVHLWTNRPTWPQAQTIPEETPPTPKYLDWDLFLGPAKDRPYHPAYVPFKWRGWYDFGTGALGDIGCHVANMAFTALKLENPSTVFPVRIDPAVVKESAPESFPASSQLVFEFPARMQGDVELPACKVHWYDGNIRPDQSVLSFLGEEKPAITGCLIVGSEGKLYAPGEYGQNWKLYPEEAFAKFEPPALADPPPVDHFTDFVNAIQKNDPSAPRSNFNISGKLCEMLLVGNLAVRTGERIEWDHEAARVQNFPAANELLKREYRSGWTL